MASFARHAPVRTGIAVAAAGLLAAVPSRAETGCFPKAMTHAIHGAVMREVPRYLETVRDPHYGGKVTLVTDAPGTPMRGLPGRKWPQTARHRYASHQAWNADRSLIYLARGRIFLDGETYQPRALPPLPEGFWHWSPVDPDLMIIPRVDGVGTWNVRRGRWTQIISIPGYSGFRSETRDNPSYDGTRFAVKAWREADSVPVCIGVDLSTGKTGPVISFDRYGFERGGYSENKGRRCSVTASGRYIVLSGHANGSYNDQAHVFDWSGALVYRQRSNAGVECPGGHGDMGLDEHGDDVFVGICKGRGEPWSAEFSGRTVALRIPDGAIGALGRASSSHTSCRNSRRPGYCYGSGFRGEATINAKSIDGQRVEYYLDPQNNRTEYLDETQAVPSPDGLKVLFASRWKDAFADGMRLFVLDLTPLAGPGDCGPPPGAG